MGKKIKQSIAWGFLIVFLFMILFLGITGRLAIFLAIAFVPDDVTVTP